MTDRLSPDALAAIAAAYLIAAGRDEPSPHTVPRWRLAARFATIADDGRIRRAGRVGSRWAAAGRLDV